IEIPVLIADEDAQRTHELESIRVAVIGKGSRSGADEHRQSEQHGNRFFHFLSPPVYQSKCRASIGLSRAAFLAGRKPNRTPIPADIPNASITAPKPGA